MTRTNGRRRDETAQRKQADQELPESEKLQREALDAIPDSILLTDADGTISMANRAAAERFGTTVEALVGKCAFDFFSPRRRLDSLIFICSLRAYALPGCCGNQADRASPPLLTITLPVGLGRGAGTCSPP